MYLSWDVFSKTLLTTEDLLTADYSFKKKNNIILHKQMIFHPITAKCVCELIHFVMTEHYDDSLHGAVVTRRTCMI
jgi:hypothetical protein